MSAYVYDDNLFLLKKGKEVNKNIFFVHAATGEAAAYMNFCERLSDKFSCWGIKSSEFDCFGPKIFTVEQIAKKYVKKVLKVQEEGPYYIAGWCIGGTLAFQMTRELENLGEEVKFLGLINSNFMKADTSRKFVDFSVQSEAEFLTDILPQPLLRDLTSNIEACDDMWRAVIEISQQNDSEQKILKALKNSIPDGVKTTVPKFENTDIINLVKYINIMRSYVNSCMVFSPTYKLHTKLNFFKANEDTDWDAGIWNQYCEEAPIMNNLCGNNFNILEEPNVGFNSKVFNEVLDKSLR